MVPVFVMTPEMAGTVMMYVPAVVPGVTTLGQATPPRLLVERTILLVAAHTNQSVVLREAATISCSRNVNKMSW